MVSENSRNPKNNEILRKQKLRKKIVIMVPYPAQGHVTPMLKLASYMSTMGSFEPVIILPEFIHRRIISKVDPATREGIQFMSIQDGLDEDEPRDFFSIEKAMEDHMPANLSRLMRKIDDDDEDEVGCMIVDVLASWAIEVGRGFGVEVVGFWPAMVATYFLINCIPDLIRNGVISDTGLPQIEGNIPFHPSQPFLQIENLPWLIGTQVAQKARFKFWVKTMTRSRSLKRILANSFPNESQFEQSPNNGPIIHPIGPLRSDNGPFESPTFWEEDKSCLGWLDQQKPNSVVYISFGSWVSPINEPKVRQLALALEGLKRPFIWALGPGWRNGLPNGYMEKVTKFGKIVAWAPQMDVLKHEGVGCFLTHCGWNSTMEAIQCRKNMLCFPVAGDQSLNCEYIVNVWKIGVRIDRFSIEDVGAGIKRALEDVEMKKRVEELKVNIMREEARFKVKNNMLQFMNIFNGQTDRL